MSELIERLTAATNAHARERGVGARGQVTCETSLKQRHRWRPTSCALIHDGHRCMRVDPRHLSAHECPCGTVWAR